VAIHGLVDGSNIKINQRQILYIGLWFGLASFMQPRFLLIGAVFILIFCIFMTSSKNRIRLLAIGIIALILLPALLIFRNAEAVGKATISTNLPTTMMLGVGEETLGGYKRIGPAITCETSALSSAISDNQLIACIGKWYLTHPIKTAKLAFHKSIYFWSPWDGPVAEGTMARNPWFKISPVKKIQKNAASIDLVQGNVGKTISYTWLLGQISLLFGGVLILFRRGGPEKKIAILAATPVALAWLITIGTIGDHRFRIPIMGLSLLLQTVGVLAIREKVTKAL
jgi:hypothetical protein